MKKKDNLKSHLYQYAFYESFLKGYFIFPHLIQTFCLQTFQNTSFYHLVNECIKYI